jgi:hypothetical protein
MPAYMPSWGAAGWGADPGNTQPASPAQPATPAAPAPTVSPTPSPTVGTPNAPNAPNLPTQMPFQRPDTPAPQAPGGAGTIGGPVAPTGPTGQAGVSGMGPLLQLLQGGGAQAGQNPIMSLIQMLAQSRGNMPPGLRNRPITGPDALGNRPGLDMSGGIVENLPRASTMRGVNEPPGGQMGGGLPAPGATPTPGRTDWDQVARDNYGAYMQGPRRQGEAYDPYRDYTGGGGGRQDPMTTWGMAPKVPGLRGGGGESNLEEPLRNPYAPSPSPFANMPRMTAPPMPNPANPMGGPGAPSLVGALQPGQGVPAGNPMAGQMNSLLGQLLRGGLTGGPAPTTLPGGAQGLPASNPMAGQMNALLSQALLAQQQQPRGGGMFGSGSW